MKISIIIPVYNAEKTIIACLESLYSQSSIPNEVIVIDNNSTDKTVQLVNYFIEHKRITNLILCHEVKRGQAAARNRGINVSSGDIIAFLDSDCVAKEDWIEQIRMAFIKDTDLDIIGGKFFSHQPRSLISKFLATFWAPNMKRVEESRVNKKTDFFLDKYIHIFNSAFKKDILLKLKGFDEEMFPSGEDMDIWMRALDMGAKIIAWQPNIIIFHIQRETIKALIKQAFIYGESLAHLSKKHFGNKIIIPILPFHKVFNIKSFFTLVICPSFIKMVSIFLIFLLSLIFSLKTRIITILLLFFYIYFIIIQKIKDAKIKISFIEKIGLFFLFFIRELAEETGRMYGSLRHRVICL